MSAMDAHIVDLRDEFVRLAVPYVADVEVDRDQVIVSVTAEPPTSTWSALKPLCDALMDIYGHCTTVVRDVSPCR